MKKSILLILVLTLKFSYSQIINTIAGGAAIVNGQSASVTPLQQPNALAKDGNGNIYVADNANHLVRRINPSGIMTIIAGTGVAGYNGDGLAATSAQLKNPHAVAVDLNGNVYISDSYNNRIRKVTPTGIITTIAGTGVQGHTGDGGQAINALIYSPFGIMVDNIGNIVFGEMGSGYLRKITPSGIITTIAGTGTLGYSGDGGLATLAGINLPSGMACDNLGNYYICDRQNYRIRKISTTGIISTIAGTGISGNTGNGGPAVNANIGDSYWITLDQSGNIYFSDWANHQIKKISTAGIITTIAGIGVNGWSGNGGPALSANLSFPTGIIVNNVGEVYFSEEFGNDIRKIQTNGIINTIAGGPPQTNKVPTDIILNGPMGITLNKTGEIIFTEAISNVIRKISETTGTISTIVGNGIRDGSANGIPALNASLFIPYDVALDTNGVLYITDSGSGMVRKINSSGNVQTVAGIMWTNNYNPLQDGGLATNAQITQPVSICFDKYNNLYISCGSNIRKVTTGGIISTVAGTGTLGFSGDGGLATQANIQSSGICADKYDNIYFAERNNNRIRKISPTGIITTIAGGGTVTTNGILATNAQIFAPWSIKIDDNKNIYFTESSKHRIRKIDSTGIITLVAGTTVGSSGDGGSALLAKLNFGGSGCLAVTKDGKTIYISDSGNGKIRKISNLPIPQICMVTVDTSSKSNYIYWDKSSWFNIDSILIYREINSSPSTYGLIGARDWDSLSFFADTARFIYPINGDPNITTYRYKIQLKDKKNNISFLSDYHNSIYVNNSNSSFTWNQYGIQNSPNPVSYYELWRDSLSNGNWELVGTTAGNQTTLNDPKYSNYQSTGRWRVETIWDLNCSASYKSINNSSPNASVKSRSNTKSNKIIGVGINAQTLNADQVKIYPNPSSGNVTIDLGSVKHKVSYQLNNVLGQILIKQNQVETQNINIDLTSLKDGLYTITIITEQGTVVKKVVKD